MGAPVALCVTPALYFGNAVMDFPSRQVAYEMGMDKIGIGELDLCIVEYLDGLFSQGVPVRLNANKIKKDSPLLWNDLQTDSRLFSRLDRLDSAKVIAIVKKDETYYRVIPAARFKELFVA